MPGLEQAVIREPDADTPAEYAGRVRRLAAFYAILFVFSIAGSVLLIWKAQLFVGLAQRSNVETLILAFFLVFFGYIALISAGGALGALRIARYALEARLGDPVAIERRKDAALGGPGKRSPTAALNVILEQDGAPGEPFAIPVADLAGRLGEIVVDGASVAHRGARRGGSNSVLAYFVHQVNARRGDRGADRTVDIVEWESINDETARQYLGLVQFARRLERHLGAEELWPKVVLTGDDCRAIEERLGAICPALRSEAFLPDWEFEAEHKLPLIPEPLGLISLSRTEKRADPVATMGCAVYVVVAAVAVLALFVVLPPWVPGS